MGFGIRDPRSGIRKKPIPDPGSRGQKGTESRIRICNTASYRIFIYRILGLFAGNLSGRYELTLPGLPAFLPNTLSSPRSLIPAIRSEAYSSGSLVASEYVRSLFQKPTLLIVYVPVPVPFVSSTVSSKRESEWNIIIAVAVIKFVFVLVRY